LNFALGFRSLRRATVLLDYVAAYTYPTTGDPAYANAARPGWRSRHRGPCRLHSQRLDRGACNRHGQGHRRIPGEDGGRAQIPLARPRPSAV